MASRRPDYRTAGRSRRSSAAVILRPFLDVVRFCVRLTLRTEPRGGPCAEADAARRLPPLRLTRCGRRAAVTLGGLPSRLGRRAYGSPPPPALGRGGRRRSAPL